MFVLRLTPFFLHASAPAWPARYDAVGGMQVQLLELTKWLDAAGVEQLVITTGMPGVPARYRCGASSAIESTRHFLPEVASKRTGLVGRVECWAFGIFMRMLSAEVRRADLIHLHLDGEWATIVTGWIIQKLVRKPLVLTVHCSRIAVYRPTTAIDRWIHPLARECEARLISASAGVIALTETTRSALRAASKPRLLACIPDGLNFSELTRPREDVSYPKETSEFLARPGPLLAFLGRIAPEKGWRTLVAVMQSLKSEGARLIVIGDGPERSEFELEATKASVRHLICVTGFLPRRHALALLSTARVLLMPSKHEELGGAAVEAFGLGIPVVACGVGGLRYTVGATFPQLTAPPDDVQAFISIVREVLRRPDDWFDAARAERWARENFDADVNFKKTLDFYASVLTSAYGS